MVPMDDDGMDGGGDGFDSDEFDSEQDDFEILPLEREEEEAMANDVATVLPDRSRADIIQAVSHLLPVGLFPHLIQSKRKSSALSFTHMPCAQPQA